MNLEYLIQTVFTLRTFRTVEYLLDMLSVLLERRGNSTK